MLGARPAGLDRDNVANGAAGPLVSMETTSPMVPLVTSALAVAKEGCVVLMAPQLKATPASEHIWTIRSACSRVWVGDRLFGKDTLRAVLDREAGEVGTHLGIGGNGNDVQPLLGQHLGRVGVDGLDTVANTG